jgi:N utilization substance protein B
MVYAAEMGGQSPNEVERWYTQTQPMVPDVREFAGKLLDRLAADGAHVDELIARHLRAWRMERLSAIDRSVLKVATAELLLDVHPVAVVITEALHLAQKFSQPEASRFINAVLDGVALELHPTATTRAKRRRKRH